MSVERDMVEPNNTEQVNDIDQEATDEVREYARRNGLTITVAERIVNPPPAGHVDYKSILD